MRWSAGGAVACGRSRLELELETWADAHEFVAIGQMISSG
jgi:hypothetical protein